MEEGIKPILERDAEEWERLKFKINYHTAEHIEHSCTFCYNQIIYDDVDYCDATDKWIPIDDWGVCELWKKTPHL